MDGDVMCFLLSVFIVLRVVMAIKSKDVRCCWNEWWYGFRCEGLFL